jgi:hypothetical protein
MQIGQQIGKLTFIVEISYSIFWRLNHRYGTWFPNILFETTFFKQRYKFGSSHSSLAWRVLAIWVKCVATGDDDHRGWAALSFRSCLVLLLFPPYLCASIQLLDIMSSNACLHPFVLMCILLHCFMSLCVLDWHLACVCWTGISTCSCVGMNLLP